MENNISNAFLLLCIGMSTVFLILFLIVSLGKFLINWVNTLPEPQPEMVFKKITEPSAKNLKHVAVITAAVHHVTNGKGKIDKIDKI